MSQFSMIKCSLAVKENVNVRQLPKLLHFSNKKFGYHSKKSELFSADRFTKFIFEIPDEKWLLFKFILI